MWILKGTFLGVGLFFVGAIIYLVLWLRADSQFSGAKAIGLSVISYLTIYNPFFWASLAASLVIGCGRVRSWPAGISVS
jgi:hypothetical protein